MALMVVTILGVYADGRVFHSSQFGEVFFHSNLASCIVMLWDAVRIPHTAKVGRRWRCNGRSL